MTNSVRPAFLMTERMWQIVIVAFSGFVILLTIWCTMQGIRTVFMHLYYIPIVLLAYHYRKKGVLLSVLLSLFYLACTVLSNNNLIEIEAAILRVIIFIAIAGLIAYLSENLVAARDSLKTIADIQQGIIQNANVWLMVLEKNGRIREWNRAAEEMSGYAASEVVGKNTIWKLLYPEPEYRKKITGKIAEIIAKNNYLENIRTSITCKDGNQKTLLWNTKELPGEEGQSTRYIAVGVDVTVRTQQEDEIRLSNVILKTQQETSPDGILIVDEFGKILSFNKRFVEILGIPPEVIASGSDEPVLSFVLDKVIRPEEFLARVKYLYEHREEKSQEEIQLKVGTVIERYSTPMLGEDNRYFGRVWYFHDITERKIAETTLRESEEKYRAFFSTSQDCVFITTLDGRWVDFNDTAVKLFGYESREDLMRITIPHIYANPEERDAHITYIQENGYSFEYPVNLRKKDGTIINALITTAARKDASGSVISFQGSIRDITERKRTDELLLENQVQLATAMDMALLANWEFDVTTGIFTFNDRFYAMCGTTAEREGGYQRPAEMYAREFVHPDDADMVAEEFKKAIETPDPLFMSQVEHRIIRRDGAIRYIIVRHAVTKDAEGRTIKTHGANQDITERKVAENALALEKQRMESLLSLSLMSQKADPEIVAEVVEDAIRLTGSKIGYLATMNDDESVMTIQYWSKSAHESCKVIDKPIIYSVEKTGLWGEAVRQRKPIVTNDYAADSPFKRGIPKGHVSLVRHMNIPVFDGDHIVAVAGVGNKEVDYDEGDIRQLQLLMQGWWQVTVRKRTEEALWESREHYRAIIDYSQIAIAVLDVNHKIIMVNPRFSQLFKKPVGDFVGKYCFNEFEKRDAVCTHCPGVRAMISRKPEEAETEGVLDDGSRFYARNRAVPFFGPDGAVKGFVEMVEDITDRKHAEDALRESRQLFSDIISFLPDPTMVIDLQGRVLSWNRALEQLSGIPAGDMIGKGNYEYSFWLYGKRRPILIDLVLHPDQDYGRTGYTGIQREGQTVIAQTELIRPGNKTIVLSLVTSPLYDANGMIVGAIESMRDITRLKEAEEELARLNTNLEQIIRDRTNALKEEVEVRKQAEAAIQASLDEKVLLLREIHHRVKNNLQIIISLTNLQMRKMEEPRMKQVMAETQNRVRAMSLVHEKLYQSENISSIDLADYTRYLATQLFSFYGIDHRNVTLHTDIGKIPLDINTAIPLGLILNELISNALKHAFADGRAGSVSISGHAEGSMLTLVVRDDGTGLRPDFDWKNTESLGLRLVNSLVDQLGGTIEPGEGSGTTFVIVVPMRGEGGDADTRYRRPGNSSG